MTDLSPHAHRTFRTCVEHPHCQEEILETDWDDKDNTYTVVHHRDAQPQEDSPFAPERIVRLQEMREWASRSDERLAAQVSTLIAEANDGTAGQLDTIIRLFAEIAAGLNVLLARSIMSRRERRKLRRSIRRAAKQALEAQPPPDATP